MIPVFRGVKADNKAATVKGSLIVRDGKYYIYQERDEVNGLVQKNEFEVERDSLCVSTDSWLDISNNQLFASLSETLVGDEVIYKDGTLEVQGALYFNFAKLELYIIENISSDFKFMINSDSFSKIKKILKH